MINEATKGIPDEEKRKAVAERLNAGLRTAERPPRPDFPEEWRSEPTVMFSAGDPEPEPFDWGPSKWTTERTRMTRPLRSFSVISPAAATRPRRRSGGLARRALEAARLQDGEPDRVWPRLFAARVIGADCPLAEGLADHMRRQFEQLAAQADAAAAPSQESPRAPVE